jgi:N-acetylmuramic acid 6-phosphate etherase
MSLTTELPSPHHAALDTYDTASLVDAFVADQGLAASAVRQAAAAIAKAVDLSLPRVAEGGRLVYVGAGTSGRLGMLDSVELLPTFSWPSGRARALIAGGSGAMFVAVEGAEDDRGRGVSEFRELEPTRLDVALLIAASGTTPYVLGAAEAARASGALTIGFANNLGSPLAAACEVAIELDTGPEVISGSTRLKAGTAQKIALNTFSSALMVKLKKVYGNLMVDLKATNAKLRRRAVTLTARATGADEQTVTSALEQCGYHIKTAVVMIGAHVDAGEAERKLAEARGSVRAVLGR